ncbi:MAG TPA: beta-ketoacyl synthase N-terminal-like domain-containing protein [Candidatus Limnocylindrales bacterium]|nr:beta-ketoacyl synthase N-terminal-like domain-containing protein [Candidatus Limnocylindrales bacterium]
MSAVVVTGTGLLSPVASSPAELLAANADESPPGPQAWFDPVTLLGRRGWKYLSPATRYLLGATVLALADARLEPAGLPDESMGVVVGTNFAARPVVARIDETVITEGAHMLSPAEAPNFSVNVAASAISMRYGMRAFNLSLTNPMVAGLESVLILAASIGRGRAELGLAGATEESPIPASAGDGACCFVLETVDGADRRGATGQARVAGGFSRFIPPGGDMRAVRGPLTRLLASTETGQVPHVVVGQGDLASSVEDLAERSAADAGISLARRGFAGADGRYFTVSPMLQMAGLIATERQGVVIAVSPHGNLAALRLARW